MSTVQTTAPKCNRYLRWTRNADDHSPTAGCLQINDNGKQDAYIVTEFPTGLTGRGFTVTAITGRGYTVVISDRGARWDECTCDGFHYRRTCRHCSAIRTLIGRGKI